MLGGFATVLPQRTCREVAGIVQYSCSENFNFYAVAPRLKPSGGTAYMYHIRMALSTLRRLGSGSNIRAAGTAKAQQRKR